MKLTPAQKQYLDIKNQHKDAILFFRMWDFYEVFYNDAKICAKVLNIALTSRDRNSENPVPMAWIPYHSVEKYLPKLLEAWYKVAIAEQVGNVVPWKVVERKVTQIITPWSYVKESKNENTILAIISNKWKYFISYWDISIWVFYIQEIESLEKLKDILFKIQAKEYILPLDIENKEEIENYISTFLNPFISHSIIPYEYEQIVKSKTHLDKLDSFGQSLDKKEKIQVLWMLFEYIEQLNIDFNILKIKFVEDEKYIYFDSLSIKNLEIIQSSYDQNKKYSLLLVLDKTITSSWSRLLKNWILHPLKDKKEIKFRLEWFEYFMNSKDNSENIKKELKNIYDIERIAYLIQFKQNNPFHWLKLKISLNAIENITNIDNTYIKLSPNLEKLKEVLNKWLKDDDFSVEKDFIQDNFSSKIDELRKIAYHSDKLIIDYQQELIKKLGIPVKIKYVNNQWYLIEVSKKDTTKLDKFINSQTLSEEELKKFSLNRKQTLKIAERYITPYLKELEEKSLNAIYELKEEEKKILEQWKLELQKLNSEIELLSQKIGNIDIFINLWEYFKNNNYTKPEIWHKEIKIIWWRHPVIERFLTVEESFIENDLNINNEIVHIITWPNMGGKSTYLRQNALILLLAHCGFFVPAKKCETPILTWIFARVGSWDILAKNQSTFMTEMIEVANILNNADENSFIIFDELWRWTSTYDGMAISQAVIEYIVNNLKAKTLFATHYHELIKLEKKYKSEIKNYSVAVYENNWKIIFMKKIVPWWASKSYWIHVWELAWLPKEIIDNSKNILKNLEKIKDNKKIVIQNLFDIWENNLTEKEYQDLEKYKKLEKKLKNININNTTPLEALEILNSLLE